MVIFLRKIRKTWFFGGRARLAPTGRLMGLRWCVGGVMTPPYIFPPYGVPYGAYSVSTHPAIDYHGHCEPKAWQSPGRQSVIARSTRRFPRSLRSLGMTEVIGDQVRRFCLGGYPTWSAGDSQRPTKIPRFLGTGGFVIHFVRPNTPSGS